MQSGKMMLSVSKG